MPRWQWLFIMSEMSFASVAKGPSTSENELYHAGKACR
jgi:hypothetical protein